MRLDIFEMETIFSKIEDGIYSFEMTYNEHPHYVVMSYATRSVLINIFEDKVFYANNKIDCDGMFGIPIAYNDSLQVGVVDIV